MTLQCKTARKPGKVFGAKRDPDASDDRDMFRMNAHEIKEAAFSKLVGCRSHIGLRADCDLKMLPQNACVGCG